jgi:hypothetical protein
VKHRAVTAEDRGDVDVFRELRRGDAVALTGKCRGIRLQNGGAAVGGERVPEGVKGGKRALLVGVYEDSYIHDATANDRIPRLASHTTG